MLSHALDLARYTVSPYAVAPLLVGITIWILGILVLLGERVSRVSVLFCLVTLSIGVWLVSFAGMYCAPDAEVARWWAKAAYLGVPLIPSAIYHFAMEVAGGTGRKRRLVGIGWALSGVFAAAIVGTDALIGSLTRYWWGYYPRYGWLSVPYLTFFFGMMAASLRAYWVAYRRATPGSLPRSRHRAFLVAFAVVHLGSVDYLAKFGIPLYPFGYLPVLIFVGLSARAIWRYRLSEFAPASVADQILSTISDAIVVCDARETIRSINREACALLGYTEQELLGLPLTRVAEPGEAAHQRLRDVLREGGARDHESRFCAKGGRVVPVSLSVATRYGAQRRVTGWVLVARDIRERKQAEEELWRAYAQTEQILMSISSLLIGVDGRGCVSRWNAVAESLLGVPAKQVLGRSLADCPIPWENAPVLRGLAECERTRAQVRLEDVRCTRSDGSAGWLGLTISPLEALGEQPAGYVLLGADVTGRRLTEREREEQLAALERGQGELAQREWVMHSLLEDLQSAKDLIEGQAATLRSSNAKLRELAAVKDEFVAKVSHELRTPLTSIKEGLSLILDGALGQTTSDQQEFLGTMDAEVDRLTDLINNMLDISKIEASRMRLARARLDVGELIASLLRSCQPLLGRRAVRTECEEVALVFADRHRMAQVLTNLLSNAIKFTDEQRGSITFRLGRQDGMAAISVEDNGPGIASEDVPKLFQKFSQVGAQPKGQPRGTGLGLVVCKELVELHGGRIETRSAVGQGTAFTVLLPAYSDHLALSESFRELTQQEALDEPQPIGVIAIQAVDLLDGQETPEGRRRELERLASDVSTHLHRGDAVLAVDPSWIVVLALTDAAGIEAIVRRLQGRVPQGERLQVGAAVCPLDGTEAFALFQLAASRVGQPLPAPTAASTQDEAAGGVGS